MTVSLIWAQAANGVIGRHGTLPWHLPEDLQHFKSLTMGATVVMGRSTWESLPETVRPLPGRRNVVLTGEPSWSAPGAVVAHSLDEALAAAGDPVWVIGGASVYAVAIDAADRLVVTELADVFAGDAYAPVVDRAWRLVGREPEVGWRTSDAGLRYCINDYARNRSVSRSAPPRLQR